MRTASWTVLSPVVPYSGALLELSLGVHCQYSALHLLLLLSYRDYENCQFLENMADERRVTILPIVVREVFVIVMVAMV